LTILIQGLAYNDTRGTALNCDLSDGGCIPRARDMLDHYQGIGNRARRITYRQANILFSRVNS
jgi:hypothetical protein